MQSSGVIFRGRSGVLTGAKGVGKAGEHEQDEDHSGETAAHAGPVACH